TLPAGLAPAPAQAARALELAPPPHRLALLLERARALLGVLRGHDRPCERALLLPHLRPRPVEPLLEHALGRGQRQPPALAHPARQLERDLDGAARLAHAR